MPDIHDAIARYPSLRRAAKEWGVSAAFVSNIARGQMRMSIRMAARIEAATGISARDLLLPQFEKDLEEAKKWVADVKR
jgi:plasmid maintenance system antidote protein VapI